jgi:hypothetical protein
MIGAHPPALLSLRSILSKHHDERNDRLQEQCIIPQAKLDSRISSNLFPKNHSNRNTLHEAEVLDLTTEQTLTQQKNRTCCFDNVSHGYAN